MRRGGKIAPMAALITAVFATAAHAEYTKGPISVGGFGTAGAVFHDEKGLEFRRSFNQPEGAKAGEIDLKIDTRLGGQVNARLSNQVDAVVQALTHYDADRSWRPLLTRGFLRYRPLDGLELRGGRLGFELAPRNDSRNVGYSFVPIRPPAEIHGIMPRDHIDGADMTLTWPVGPGFLQGKLYGGRSGGTFVSHFFGRNAETDLDELILWGSHLQYEYQDLVVRVFQGAALPDQQISPQAVLALRFGDAEANRMADDLGRGSARTQYYGANLHYEADFIVQAQFVSTEADRARGPTGNLYYVLLGHRIGAFTPFVSYADIENRSERYRSSSPVAQTFQETVNGEQSTAVLGVRWDFAPKLALKFQLDYVWLDGAHVMLDRNSPPRHDGNEMLASSVALDFIF